MTPTLLDLALKAGMEYREHAREVNTPYCDGIHVDQLEAFAKLIIEHEAEKSDDEPVAWQVMVEDEAMKEFSIRDMAHDWCVQQKLRGSTYAYWIRPLYTRPQPAAKRKPLTNEQIEAIHQSTWMQSTATLNDFARAIEAAHGITGEQA